MNDRRQFDLNFEIRDSRLNFEIVWISQNELLGQSLTDFVHPDDHEELKRNLLPDDMQLTTALSPTGSDLVHDYNSSSSEDSTTNRNRVNEKNKLFHEQRRKFKIRMAQRTVNRREHTQYETFDISGVLRLAEACKNADANGNRGRHRGENLYENLQYYIKSVLKSEIILSFFFLIKFFQNIFN